MTRQKILFIAEAVTLAHVCRLFVLAKCLPTAEYEVYFACDPRMLSLFDFSGFQFCPIKSIRSEDFLERIETGKRLYSYEELLFYSKEDLALLQEVKPDLVIGDMRVSLSVVSQVVSVPYWLVINAYWSPYSRDQWLPAPEIRGVKIHKLPFINAILKLTQPLVLNFHLQAINRLADYYKVKRFNTFLQSFTYADQVLYPDIPSLAECKELPSNHCFLGQVKWSAPAPFPHELNVMDRSRPQIFINLGSSGPASLLEQVISALSSEGYRLIVATAGRIKLKASSNNIFISDYMPAEAVTKLCNLVVCNGGSPSTYLALSNAVPVVGIPTNLDQLLNMRNIENRSCGLMLRSSDFSVEKLKAVCSRVLNEDGFKIASSNIAKEFLKYNAEAIFADKVNGFMNEGCPNKDYFKKFAY